MAEISSYVKAKHKPGVMNSTEKEYSIYLEALCISHEIKEWIFEPIKFRLADKTYYTPDFAVRMNDDTVEFHEVKGHWLSSARVKIKVAAEQHRWFSFIGVTKEAKKRGGGWKREEF